MTNTNEKYVVVYRFNGFDVDLIENKYGRAGVTTNEISEAKHFSYEAALLFVLNNDHCRMISLSKALELSGAVIQNYKYAEHLHKEQRSIIGDIPVPYSLAKQWIETERAYQIKLANIEASKQANIIKDLTKEIADLKRGVRA